MNATKPRIDAIAEAYGCTRQRIHQMRQKYNLKPKDFEKPGKVFGAMLKHQKASAMRSRLADPIIRQSIKTALNS